MDRYFFKVTTGFLIAVGIFLAGCHFSRQEAEKVSAVRDIRIAIFKEEGFPSQAIPPSLSPQYLYGLFDKHCLVEYVNFARLVDEKYFNTERFDFFLLPYGETFPLEGFDAICRYLYAGGGLIHTGGRPFWQPVVRNRDHWEKVETGDPYEDFLIPLGITYYQPEASDDVILNVTTSLKYSPVTPTHGNVFPYRIPARDFYPFSILTDNPADDAVTFVKTWQNPYGNINSRRAKKWCLIGATGYEHPFLSAPSSTGYMSRLIDRLSFPLILHDVRTNFAAYRQGEEVKISFVILNQAETKREADIEIEIIDEKKRITWSKIIPVVVDTREGISVRTQWKPDSFADDFYRVEVRLKYQDRVYDCQQNGFVVIDEAVLSDGPVVEVGDTGIMIDGEDAYFLGVNYYESRRGELMWVMPDVSQIQKDFAMMHRRGMNYVRIHYHHSKWFRDYFSRIKEELPAYLADADTTVLPSERSLRILDAVIQLAQKYRLIFCIDLFSLVPQEMGDPIGWLGLRERMLDQDKIEYQKQFIRLIADRYKGVPGITWDLWNEPRLDDADISSLKDWAQGMVDEFRKSGDMHPITIGGNISIDVADILDYVCVHTDSPGDFQKPPELAKPYIFQEVWNPASCGYREDVRQAKELEKDFQSFLDTDAVGFIPWQWTHQARLWNIYKDERWDDELGLCTRGDGAIKPAGERFFQLIKELQRK